MKTKRLRDGRNWRAAYDDLQPLDRTAIAAMLALAAAILLTILVGDRASARVRDFSWAEETIGADDRAFVLTFTRPMDRESVEANLQIDPPLPGKPSWAGRRMAYTLAGPAPYGSEFQVRLKGARELDRSPQPVAAPAEPDAAAETPDTENSAAENSAAENSAAAQTSPGDRATVPKENRQAMAPFASEFRTRDRAFAYIGAEGQEMGRLVLYNLTRQEKTILTPDNLLVTDFDAYPDRERLLFSASDRLGGAQGPQTLEQKLYTVTTGLTARPGDWLAPSDRDPGQVELVLDNPDYQTLKFDLSPDGRTIVVQRANRSDPADFGLWILQDGGEPERLESEPGGEFVIAPDSRALAVSQGQGVALLPLPDPETPEPERDPTRGQSAAEPLDFLPQFGTTLSFAPDGTAAALVKFNSDYTRSLYVVDNRGNETNLGSIRGSILDAQFGPNNDTLYCLMTEMVEDADRYREQPYFAAIDLEEKELVPLLLLPELRDVQMDLAPDGLGILFDRAIARPELSLEEGANLPKTSDGSPIVASELWLLPLVGPLEEGIGAADPQPLPLQGFRPRWLA